MNRNSFIIYKDDWSALQSLSNDDLGKVMRQVFEYVCDDLTPEKPSMAFLFMKQHLDRDKERFDDISQKRAEAAKRKWDQINALLYANGCKCMQMDASKGDIDNDIDIDIELRNNKKEDKEKFNAYRELLALGVSSDTAKDYIDYRKNNKSQLNATIIKRLKSQAEQVGWSVEHAITYQMERGWKGFLAKYISPEDMNTKDLNSSEFSGVKDCKLNEL